MDKLTIEEKAKRYDELSKEVKDFFDGKQKMYSDVGQTLSYLFPEFRDSEDERIRKSIISGMKALQKNGKYTRFANIPVNNVIAWLEKQGEQKDPCETCEEPRLNCQNFPCEKKKNFDFSNKVEPKFKVGDVIKPKDGGHEPWQIMQVDMFDKKYRFKDGCVIHFSQEDAYELIEQKPTDEVDPKFKCGDRVRNKKSGLEQTIGGCLEDVYEGAFPFFINDQDDWELIEQKSSDNVEPKFKLDDWVVYKENTYQIHNISLKTYYECLRTDGTVHIFDFEYIDSKSHLWTIKDAKDGDVLTTSAGAFIYNGNNGGGSCPGSYCGINTLGRFQTGVETHWTGKSVFPATKAQCDTLMKAMTDAGYTFDFEKKEVRKIKQKPTEWNKRDEEMIQGLNNCLDELEEENGWYYVYVNNKNVKLNNIRNWLKSLRPQNHITDEELAQAKKNAYNDALDKIEYHSGNPTFDDGWSAAIDYIRKKSLRP